MQSTIKTTDSLKKKISLSRAEKKLMILLVYYLVFTVVLEVYFLVLLKALPDVKDTATEFFTCEAGGYNPASPCPKDYEKHTNPWLQMFLHIVLTAVPLFSLVFILRVNTRKVRRFTMERRRRRRNIVNDSVNPTHAVYYPTKDTVALECQSP